TLKHLAELYIVEGKLELAAQLHKRAETILEKKLGPNLSDLGNVQKRRGTPQKRAERQPKPNTAGSNEPNIIKTVPSLVEDEG
ncbi:MAG TPA: hypothetical protein VIX20_06440, partial [Ktedonobacteraceae bacterium]